MDEMDTLSNSRPGEGSFRPQSQLSHLHHGRTKFKSLNPSSRLARMPQSKPVEKKQFKTPIETGGDDQAIKTQPWDDGRNSKFDCQSKKFSSLQPTKSPMESPKQPANC